MLPHPLLQDHWLSAARAPFWPPCGLCPSAGQRSCPSPEPAGCAATQAHFRRL